MGRHHRGPHKTMNPLGLTDGEIYLAEYSPEWKELFLSEERLIRSAIAEIVQEIHHIGSTSVPRMPGKPVLDIGIGLAQHGDGHRSVGPLEGLGYEYKGDYGIPGRFYFRKTSSGRRTHQIHMFEAGDQHLRDHLLFRDYLIGHPDEAEEYAKLKRRLIDASQGDITRYSEGKDDFVRRVLAAARKGD